MNPQQKEFDTALAGLTPEQRATYMKANPTVGVGGVQQSANTGTYQPIPKTITTGDINSSPNLIPVPPKAPISTYSPIVTAPTGTAMDVNGIATYTPPPPPPEPSAKEKTLRQKTMELIGMDEKLLEQQPEVQAQLQERLQLIEKENNKVQTYNAWMLKKREIENRVREMEATNPEGQFGGARSAVIQDYQRKASAELADLAIQAQVAQGLVDSARQTIKDTIEAQFSPIEDRIARRTQYAQLAANDLTESEKYKLDQLNKKDETNQKEVSTFATNLANTVFENGAPVGVRTKIFNIAGDYAAGKITKEQAQAKMMEAAGNYGVKVSTAEKAPTVQKINGVDMQWNPASGKWETPSITTTGTTSASTMPLAQAQTSIKDVDQLLNGGVGMDTAVGTSILTRSTGVLGNLSKVGLGLVTGGVTGATIGAPFAGVGAIPGAIVGGVIGAGTALFGTGKQLYSQLSGAEQDFIAGVEQLRSNLNLDSLIDAKARGATFGALSDQELKVLANASTRIGQWAIKDSNGNVVGYNTTTEAFKKELNKINNFAKLDYIIKGGDPMDVNAQMQSDGSIWVKNSDGTLTQIK